MLFGQCCDLFGPQLLRLRSQPSFFGGCQIRLPLCLLIGVAFYLGRFYGGGDFGLHSSAFRCGLPLHGNTLLILSFRCERTRVF